jgi:hypothetical protein
MSFILLPDIDLNTATFCSSGCGSRIHFTCLVEGESVANLCCKNCIADVQMNRCDEVQRYTFLIDSIISQGKDILFYKLLTSEEETVLIRKCKPTSKRPVQKGSDRVDEILGQAQRKRLNMGNTVTVKSFYGSGPSSSTSAAKTKS